MNTTRLSPHFLLSEFTYSKTAELLGIPNNPTGSQVDNMAALCHNVLEPVRAHFGKPVKINSGFRSLALNESMVPPGAKNSQHMKGEAADIEIPGVANADIWQWIVDNLEYDQCIAERLERDDPSAGWIHVSYSIKKNRREALSSPRVGQYELGLVYV